VHTEGRLDDLTAALAAVEGEVAVPVHRDLELWPIHRDTSWMGTPLLRVTVAHLCRRSWGSADGLDVMWS
jgi:hypothetical protein